MKYIDAHTHMHDERFVNIESLMKSSVELDLVILTIGTDYHDSLRAMDFASKYQNAYYTIGVHPHDILNAEFDENKFKELISDKCLAIGECGLDYYYLNTDKHKGVIDNIDREIDRQKDLFIRQIEFAIEHDLPLMLHGRPSKIDEIDNPDGMDAYHDMLDILYRYEGRVKGQVHFFVGDINIMQEFVNLGFYFSFGGVITITEDYHNMLRQVPLNRLLTETDSPYVTPKSKRGEINTSLNIPIILQEIANIRGEDAEALGVEVVKNFKELYNI